MSEVLESKEEENIWEHLLAEASSKTRLPDAQLVVVGDPQSGKKTLLKKLCSGSSDGSEVLETSLLDDSSNGPSDEDGQPVLFYSFMDAVDLTANEFERDDTPARISTWSLGDVSFENLLSIPFTAEKLKHTMIAITLDLSKPWDLMRNLEKWVKVLERAIVKVRSQLSVGDQDELMQIQNDYIASQTEVENSSKIQRNLGVPLMVIGCKLDAIEAETFEHQQKLQFIQQHLRKFCYQYGAALCFASARAGTNLGRLRGYLLHRAHPGHFPGGGGGAGGGGAQVANDELFIPSGWDTMKLIEDLEQAKTSWAPDAAFETVITPPAESLEEVKGGASPGGGLGATAGGEGAGGGAEALPAEPDWLADLAGRAAAAAGPKAGLRKPPTRAAAKPRSTDPAAAKPRGHQKKDNAQIRDFFEGLLAGGK